MEREVELEHRALEASTALARIQVLIQMLRLNINIAVIKTLRLIF